MTSKPDDAVPCPTCGNPARLRTDETYECERCLDRPVYGLFDEPGLYLDAWRDDEPAAGDEP